MKASITGNRVVEWRMIVYFEGLPTLFMSSGVPAHSSYPARNSFVTAYTGW
jgi:hypothetical protein